MRMKDYFDWVNRSSKVPSNNHLYAVLGLCGEAGEVAEKFKKSVRDDNSVITDTKRNELKKELGDVLWYWTWVAHQLDLDPADIAESNFEKVQDRKQRGKLQGSGDNR